MYVCVRSQVSMAALFAFVDLRNKAEFDAAHCCCRRKIVVVAVPQYTRTKALHAISAIYCSYNVCWQCCKFAVFRFENTHTHTHTHWKNQLSEINKKWLTCDCIKIFHCHMSALNMHIAGVVGSASDGGHRYVETLAHTYSYAYVPSHTYLYLL